MAACAMTHAPRELEADPSQSLTSAADSRNAR
jgi:hypothetical protein